MAKVGDFQATVAALGAAKAYADILEEENFEAVELRTYRPPPGGDKKPEPAKKATENEKADFSVRDKGDEQITLDAPLATEFGQLSGLVEALTKHGSQVVLQVLVSSPSLHDVCVKQNLFGLVTYKGVDAQQHGGKFMARLYLVPREPLTGALEEILKQVVSDASLRDPSKWKAVVA